MSPSITRTFGRWRRLQCQEQTLYNRLRIGHTYLTHSYLLKDEDPPICTPCNSLLTVEFSVVLYQGVVCVKETLSSLLRHNNEENVSCIDFDIICQNFYTASNLKRSHPKCIISFIP